MILSIVISLLLTSPASGGVALEAQPLKRSQLPDGFPWQVQEVGFAVIRLRILNQSAQAWDFDPQSVKVFYPRKKELKRASPEEVTPKLMQRYSKTRRGVHGESYGGYRRPIPGELARAPTIDPNRAPGTVSIDQGKRFRELLEDFEIRAATLQPGQAHEGLIYVKSKKSGARLYGGLVQLEGGASAPMK